MDLKEDLVERGDQVDEILADKDKTKEEILTLYDTWNETYEQDMLAWGYFLDKPLDDFEEITGINKDARILDLGAGTGLVGKRLTQRGFTNIDAIDGSEKMLERAKEKGIYQKCIHSWITSEPIKDIPEGGYIYFATTVEYLQPDEKQFFERFRELEDKGVWDWVLKKIPQQHLDENGPAVLLAFKVLKQEDKNLTQ